jgi:HD-GYP domain-containing protein (c-di-GMP phosphodiesterase class II)
LSPALAIPHWHHEKWDGTGYPDKLRGKEIPFEARLFALVDVYDALTSSRSYRGAWSGQETLDYIESQSGRHFDPALVPEFVGYINKHAL